MDLRRGFTLIELLVVIAIIGVLSAVVLAALNEARAGARDAKRKMDLQQIAKALDMYFLDVGRYPVEVHCDSSRGSSSSACNTVSGTNWDTSSQFVLALVPTYIPALPVDPQNSASFFYSYEPSNPASDYCLAVNLEKGGRYVLKQGTTAPGSC